MPPSPKLGSMLPSALKRITVALLSSGSGVVSLGSGRERPARTMRPCESTATPARTKSAPGGRGTLTVPPVPKVGSGLPLAR